MSKILNKIYLYKPRDVLNGILQHYYIKNKDFADFRSLYSYDGSLQYIFTNNVSYYKSINISNPSIAMTLSNHIIRLTHLTLRSCEEIRCFDSLNVYGSNNEEQWEKICEIKENYTYFKGKPALVKCESNFFYKSIKFVHEGITDNNESTLLLRYLEMFGYLSSIKLEQLYTHCYNKHSSVSYVLSLIFLSR